MRDTNSKAGSFDQELRSLLATLDGLVEFAQEQGDGRTASILHNTALFLAVALDAAPGVTRRTQTATAASMAQRCGTALA